MSSIPAKDWKSVWELLTSGIRDYVRKNGFTDVVLGLSGAWIPHLSRRLPSTRWARTTCTG